MKNLDQPIQDPIVSCSLTLSISLKVLKEVEIYYLCSGHPNIIQLVEYFEEEDYFYLVFEKANGGPLLGQIQRRVRFSEAEAAKIVRDLASALEFLHCRGIAHRDLKVSPVDDQSDNISILTFLVDSLDKRHS